MLNNTVGLEFEIEKVSVGLTDGHFFMQGVVCISWLITISKFKKTVTQVKA